MELKIYVGNLGAYNAGILKGEWFTLPVEEKDVFDEIFDKHELDEHGNRMGDWAIFDYELPFRISEHESIANLNEIALYMEHHVNPDLLKKVYIDDFFDVEDLLELARQLNVENVMLDEIVDIHFIQNDIEKEVLEGNLASVKRKLAGVEFISGGRDDYFLINGNGHFETIQKRHLDVWKEDVFNTFLATF